MLLTTALFSKLYVAFLLVLYSNNVCLSPFSK